MTQHAALSAERWARFSRTQQLLQIGVEMQRASSCFSRDRFAILKACYERVLRLVDLTVEVNPERHFRRELLRWRDVIAELYVSEDSRPVEHRLAYRVLMQLHPETATSAFLSAE